MLKQNFIISFLIVVTLSMNSQILERQVFVTKDFEPVIQNADKINSLPDIKDTMQISPGFSYRVYPIPAKSTFEVKEIKAAKLVGVPISELYNYYLKFGVGNHHLPLIEASANNLRSNKYNVGAALNIYNLEGPVKLENDQKVNAANNNFNLMGYGKRFLKGANLEGLAGIDMNKIHYYGLSPDTVYNPLPDNKDIVQRYKTLYANTMVYSTNLNPVYSFSFGIDEQYTWDKFKYFENDLNFRLLNKVPISLFDIHVDAGLTMLSDNFNGDTVHNQTVIKFSPYIKNYKGDFRFKLGMELAVESDIDNSTTFLYPLANIEYSLAGAILTTFFGLEGSLKTNSYRDILNENPFISPGSEIKSGNNKFKAVAGIKGDLSKNLTYHLSGELMNVENHYLFVKDSIGIYDNYYKIIYDDIDITHLRGGLSYILKKKISFSLEGSKYKYLTSDAEYAWHLPDWTIKMLVKYNIQDKVTLAGDLNIIGKRYAQNLNEEAVEMKPFAIFSFQADYYFSKALSMFVSVKNLNAAQYSIWYDYPYYKAMVTVGAAYRF